MVGSLNINGGRGGHKRAVLMGYIWHLLFLFKLGMDLSAISLFYWFVLRAWTSAFKVKRDNFQNHPFITP